MVYFSKIIGVLLLGFLVACTRSPKAVSLLEAEERAKTDILKIEQIKKDNQSWEENLEIDLYTAIALAIKNNKELKIKLLESALANRQLEKIKFEMLPSIATNAGYSASENYTATSSATVTDDVAGSMGTSYSTSRQRDVNTQDIGFTWNALDFGLSYIRAGQNSNRYLIAEEMERKAEHNIVREVVKSYWNTLSADKLIRKYDPLLIEVDKALNDSQKIEELLLTKPMDALLYQKELLDIQRALQSQKQIFIDSRIQLGVLMGLLPNQKYKVVPTNDPLTVLDMNLKGMEEYALVHRPELIESHYEEIISVQETKASMASLLPGLNFNAAWTHSSNDYLMNKTNFEYGSTMGANLLNIYLYPKIKKFNETNTEVIKEKRLALSMAVLSQVHLANIDYAMALEEYDTAERYYQVSRKITQQIKNAQKIARFGNLELIREQASLLVAELRYDIAYSKLQHAIGKIYASVGLDVTKENVKKLGFRDYAAIIKNNFKSSGKKYYAKVNNPIKRQNPVVKKYGDDSVGQFSFAKNTFNLGGDGRVIYDAVQSNGKPLPLWINFLPSQRMFLINNSEKDNTEELKIIVSAKNINVRIEDSFNLLVDPELRAMRIEQEKNLEKQRKLAKKQKLDEIKRKKAEKLLQKQEEQKEKEEAEMLAKKAAEELLREQKEKKEAEMLAKKQAEELLKKQKEEAEMLAKKQMEKLLVQKKETELDLIEEKKQKEEELTALKTVTKPKKIEEKKLAKLKNSLITELRKINLIQIKKEENTPIKLEEIDFNNLFTQVNFEKNLDDAKKIEEVINKVFAPLDLESKIALTKIILKDAIKPEIRQKNETSNNKFNNQLLFLERLLDHVGIAYTKKNIDEKN
jgi:outer membrane protein TolC